MASSSLGVRSGVFASICLSVAAVMVFFFPSIAAAAFEAPDNGGGTVNLPTGDLDGDGVALSLNGLPPGVPVIDTLMIGNHNENEAPGGALGGNIQQWDATWRMTLSGAGYNRTIDIPVQLQSESGPRTPGTPVQSFNTEMLGIQGQITGDPDFDLLRITAGSGFGMPSPGHTTLTQLPGSKWAVDSFFDITYRIDFVGNPGGPFAGMSGSTVDDNHFTGVPEPSTVILCALGAIGIAALYRRS